jgi:3-deoxy-D-manno-octulosonic-acid transferase
MQTIYSLILTIIFIALLPYFVYQILVNGKYLSNLRERLGLLPDSLKSDARSTIWLHAVSVGETLTALSLVKALHARFPAHRLIISTTTATGQAVARSKITEADGFCYFPFDWKFSVRRVLNTIDPQILILMESELWLNCLSECRKRKIPVVVANGRISDRSFARSQKLGLFVRRLYNLVTRFEMQSQVDALRAVKLGAPAERVNVSGNIKYDIGKAGESPKTAETANFLDKIFALNSTPLIVAGSTSDGEEELILSVFKQLRNTIGLERTRLLIAPRHPERFDEVARLLDSSGLKYARRSTSNLPDKITRSVDVILLDSIGELAAIYQFASVVFVGGSLVMKGGHNILEPALYAKPVVVGPHMENFREITKEFLRRDALIQLPKANDRALVDELKLALVDLLNDRERALKLGENARRSVEENRGATARTVEAVAGLIEPI